MYDLDGVADSFSKMIRVIRRFKGGLDHVVGLGNTLIWWGSTETRPAYAQCQDSKIYDDLSTSTASSNPLNSCILPLNSMMIISWSFLRFKTPQVYI